MRPDGSFPLGEGVCPVTSMEEVERNIETITYQYSTRTLKYQDSNKGWDCISVIEDKAY